MTSEECIIAQARQITDLRRSRSRQLVTIIVLGLLLGWRMLESL